MPLVANSGLPTFERLQQEGVRVIPNNRALAQDIRELHIGLLNMMPDAALSATERQFFRLVGEANPIAQFYMHPFTLEALPRGEDAQHYIDQYYETFHEIQTAGLDALIITGANVTQPDLALESFWNPLIEVIDWALEAVTSTLCSCLATHAVMQFRYGQPRRHMGFKRWGVFEHQVMNRLHPLVNDINTHFDVPHSRFNDISREQFATVGVKVLVESPEAGVHLAVSEDLVRAVFFQGHPEYDTVSLMKEYKREIMLYAHGKRPDYPPFPDGYFTPTQQAILDEYGERLISAMDLGAPLPDFPEYLLGNQLKNTWHDTAEAVVANWMGMVYQLTHPDRKRPFMEWVDPQDPLGLRDKIR